MAERDFCPSSPDRYCERHQMRSTCPSNRRGRSGSTSMRSGTSEAPISRRTWAETSAIVAAGTSGSTNTRSTVRASFSHRPAVTKAAASRTPGSPATAASMSLSG